MKCINLPCLLLLRRCCSRNVFRIVFLLVTQLCPVCYAQFGIRPRRPPMSPSVPLGLVSCALSPQSSLCNVDRTKLRPNSGRWCEAMKKERRIQCNSKPLTVTSNRWEISVLLWPNRSKSKCLVRYLVPNLTSSFKCTCSCSIYKYEWYPYPMYAYPGSDYVGQFLSIQPVPIQFEVSVL